MQHARIFNSGGQSRRNHSGSSNVLSSQSLSKSNSMNSMSASQMSIQIGASRVTSSSSGNHFMNRNMRSTITVGKKHAPIEQQIHQTQTPNLVRSISKNSESLGATTIREDTPQTSTVQPNLKDPIPLTVWFHDLRTSDEDVIIDSNAIPGGVRNGQVYMLQLLETEDLKKLLFVINDRNIRDNNAAAQDDLQSVESPQQEPASQAVPIAKSKFQISLISNPLQKLLDIPPRSLVQIKRIQNLAKVEADSVEIFIKDVNLSRDSMWNFSSTLVNSCVHIDKRLLFLNNRTGIVKYIYKNGRNVFSGYIGENTKVTFRSESAKLTVLVQLSREMWHFEENGEIMFHKLACKQLVSQDV